VDGTLKVDTPTMTAFPIGQRVRWKRGALSGTVTGYKHHSDVNGDMRTLISFARDDGAPFDDWPSNLERVDG
jgi:hypothetical protein